MQGFDRKKINFIIIFIFGYFSIYNISKFNSYDSLKAAYDEDLIELEEELSFDKNNEDFVYFLIICLLIFLNPIEEVNSFYGFIIGYAFYIFKIESRQNEYI